MCVIQLQKNAHHSFDKPKVSFLNCFVYPTTSPKPKQSEFTTMNDKEKQKNLYISAALASKCLTVFFTCDNQTPL